jgi:hypothetical protein
MVHIRDSNPEIKTIVLPSSQAFELQFLRYFSQNDVNLGVRPPGMEFLFVVSLTKLYDMAPNVCLFHTSVEIARSSRLEEKV